VRRSREAFACFSPRTYLLALSRLTRSSAERAEQGVGRALGAGAQDAPQSGGRARSGGCHCRAVRNWHAAQPRGGDCVRRARNARGACAPALRALCANAPERQRRRSANRWRARACSSLGVCRATCRRGRSSWRWTARAAASTASSRSNTARVRCALLARGASDAKPHLTCAGVPLCTTDGLLDVDEDLAGTSASFGDELALCGAPRHRAAMPHYAY
jgi:hypothetical protein